MTATHASSAAPRNALRFWVSARDIFVEIPNTSTDLPATTLRFPYGPLGLAKALALLGAQPYDFGGEPMLRPTCVPKNPILNEILKRRALIP